jgi:hypothetical protein
LGRRHRPDLPEFGRPDPVAEGLQQVTEDEADAVIAQIRAAFENLSDANDWTGDGQPEGWKLIDRTFTRAEVRNIPNGNRPNLTANMANPTRTGDLVVFAYPPYQFDAATPGMLVSLSHFFGQHGYIPVLQNLDANVNMRATLIAFGNSIKPGEDVDNIFHRFGPDHRLPAAHPRAAAISRPGSAGTPERQQRGNAPHRDRLERLPRTA